MSPTEKINKKRKISDDQEILIDLSAPEPPSKKALRKAKKKDATEPPAEHSTESHTSERTERKLDGKTIGRTDFGIWIGNLAFSVTKDDLRRFLTSNCSFADTAVTRIHLPKSSEGGGKAKNKGFAYIDFSNDKALQEALGLDEQFLSGRRVLIKNAKSFEGRPQKQQDGDEGPGSAQMSGKPPSKRIFVGNLSFDTTKEAISQHFGQCGPMRNVHMATFQDTGKCKGYAWVEFEQVTAAEAAVKGFLIVSEDEEGEGDEEDCNAKGKKRGEPKKPKQRKIWVNQLLGRRMRVEFAEDPTTRYQKRFSKGEGKKGCYNSADADTGNDDRLGRISVEGQSTPDLSRKFKENQEYSRYDRDTVQKLSGTIVEPQGRKTTFD